MINPELLPVQPEHVEEINPYEKIILTLLDNMKENWTPYGIRVWLVNKLNEVEDTNGI